MSKHLLIARLGVTDTVHVPASGGEVVTELQMLNTQTQLAHGLSDTVKELLKQGVYPSPLGVDLLLTAALVYAADTRISRASESEDTWTREIRLVVPVVELDRWTAIQELLSETLNFLTGDLWTTRFRSAVGLPRIIPELPNGLAAPAISTVSLFSGGLDSLIGAVDLLQRGETPIFVSHAGDGATSKAQQECFDALATRYGRAAVTRFRFWLAFPHNLVQGTMGEDTTRARSFLFFALAASVGSGLNRPVVIRAPENGLIALNVPLDPLRLGALSTRTTHPYYIARWNEMLSRIGLPCTVENPYRHLTKGEMAQNCGDRDFLREIVASSLSCSSPSKARWQSRPTEHCGYCTPCLIRRAALEKAFGRGGDPTTYTIANLYPDLESAITECEQRGIYTLAVTTTPRAWSRNNQFASRTKHVRAALGLHPQLIAERSEEIGLWESLLPEAKYVGEIGLDAGPRFYKSFDLQVEIFGRILGACAAAGGKILSVHSVRSASKVIDMLATHFPPDRGRAVLHWFTGSMSDARRAVSAGCYFSINRMMLDRPASRRVVASIPTERLLTETDGPFTVSSDRPSKPSDVGATVSELAEVLGRPASEVRNLVGQNLRQLLKEAGE